MLSLLRRRPRLLCTAAVLTAAGAWWLLSNADEEPAPAPAAPYEYSAPQWEKLLAGDGEFTADRYTQLAAYHPGLSATEAGEAVNTAAPVLVADLTRQGRSAWPSYWPPSPTTTTPAVVRCSDTKVLGGSAADLPVSGPGASPGERWVKAVIAFSGTCGEVEYTAQAPGIEHVYLTKTGNAWTPVREWLIPRVDAATWAPPEDWQLAALGSCATSDDGARVLRTLAARAADQMCADAREAGVVLVVADTYRTRQEQQTLFNKAVGFYGDEETARQWVAFADDTVCLSRHCAAVALNVEPDNSALTWLQEVVGCHSQGRTVVSSTCSNGQSPVRRAQTYGFVAPVDRIPGYLEFVLPVDDGAALSDCNPSGVGADVIVSSVFRCRLERAGVAPDQVERVVTEALVVSRCASQWNPSAQVFAGQYAHQPHPENGRLYTEAGLFALRGELTDTGWIPAPGVGDPVASAHAAANLWLATRGWEQFPCATGTDPGLPGGPVLPQYGGPPLPVIEQSPAPEESTEQTNADS